MSWVEGVVGWVLVEEDLGLVLDLVELLVGVVLLNLLLLLLLVHLIKAHSFHQP